MALKPGKRLTLIASDPRISTALVILSVSRMLLIYLNYRFWFRMWKDTYAKFLSSGLLDRNRDSRTSFLTKYKRFHRFNLSYLEVYSSKEISMNLIFIVYSCFYECFWLFGEISISHEFLYVSYNIGHMALYFINITRCYYASRLHLSICAFILSFSI